MNILVIGNGFDLEHNLPTKYWDFLMFIKCTTEVDSWKNIKNSSNFNNLSEVTKELLRDENYYSKVDKEKANEFLEIIKSNVWINYFLKKISDTDQTKGWIDFESEISYIIRALEYVKKYKEEEYQKGRDLQVQNIQFYNDGYNFIENNENQNKGLMFSDSKFNVGEFYGDKAKEIIKKYEKDLNKLILSLEIYLEQVVELIELKDKSIDIEELNIDKVLSFNYTHTFKQVYESKNGDVEYDYIHGEVTKDKDSNNMVLGIDEYLNEDERNLKLDFIRFKKYFQRIYKKTGCRCKYKEWVKELNKVYATIDGSVELNNIYFFGHSLDVTDKDILHELLLGYNVGNKVEDEKYENYNSNVKVTIFYFNEDAYAQQITNLVKVIGQDELIARVSDGRIEFKEQTHK